MPAPDIAKRNGQKLAAMGVTEQARKAFFKNPAYTPTQATGLVDALDALAGAAGRNDALGLASRKESRRATRASTAAPPRSWLSTRRRSGRLRAWWPAPALVVPLPYDEITWTAEVDAVSASPELKGSPREIWLFGGCSSRARQELTGRGWVVREHVLAP